MALTGAPDLLRPRRAAAGTGEALSFPRTEVERLAAGPRPVRPRKDFDHVALLVGEDTGDVAIRFRRDGTAGEWHRAHPSRHAPDGERAVPVALVAAPKGSSGYEVRTESGTAVETVAMNTRDGRRLRMSGAATGTLPVTGPDRTTSASALRYVTRAGWGADESLRYADDGTELWPREYHPVQVLSVHHTAMRVDADRRASVRAVYQLHCVENGWGDIGYHLLIDPEGKVYEGRYTGGMLPIFDDPPVPGAAKSVTAGHVGGYNSGNIGVCLLGDFTDTMPTEAARDSLVDVLKTLCLVTGVDPASRVDYENPVNGNRATVPAITMHRDWGGTACPGDTFAARFDEIRRRVASLL